MKLIIIPQKLFSNNLRACEINCIKLFTTTQFNDSFDKSYGVLVFDVFNNAKNINMLKTNRYFTYRYVGLSQRILRFSIALHDVHTWSVHKY